VKRATIENKGGEMNALLLTSIASSSVSQSAKEPKRYSCVSLSSRVSSITAETALTSTMAREMERKEKRREENRKNE
jgi:hypothetical protein